MEEEIGAKAEPRFYISAGVAANLWGHSRHSRRSKGCVCTFIGHVANLRVLWMLYDTKN